MNRQNMPNYQKTGDIYASIREEDLYLVHIRQSVLFSKWRTHTAENPNARVTVQGPPPNAAQPASMHGYCYENLKHRSKFVCRTPADPHFSAAPEQ